MSRAEAEQAEREGRYVGALALWYQVLFAGHDDMEDVMDHIDATRAWSRAPAEPPAHGCGKEYCQTLGCPHAKFKVVKRDRSFPWRG